MSKPNEADLRKLLRQQPQPEVPENLLARIQAEIPEYLEVPEVDPGALLPVPSRSWPRMRLIAALLVGALGAGWLYLQLGSEMASNKTLERASEQSPAPMQAAAPTEPPVPSVQSDQSHKQSPQTQSSATLAPDLLEIEKRQLGIGPTPKPTPPPDVVAAAPPSNPGVESTAAQEDAAAAGRRANRSAAAPSPTAAAPKTVVKRKNQLSKPAPTPSRLEEKAETLPTPAAPPHPQALATGESARELREPGAGGRDRAMSKMSADSALSLEVGSYNTRRQLTAEDEQLAAAGLADDASSYVVIRSFLEAGRLPPPDVVRVDELLAHFQQGDPEPSTGERKVEVESAPVTYTAGEHLHLLRVSISGQHVTEARVRVQFDPDAISSHHLVGAKTNNILTGIFRDFSIDTAFGSTDLWQIQLEDQLDPDERIATVRVRWSTGTESEAEDTEREFVARDLEPSWGHASQSLKLATLVVRFSKLLGHKSHVDGRDFGQVAELAEELARQSGDRQAAELARLSRLAMSLQSESDQ